MRAALVTPDDLWAMVREAFVDIRVRVEVWEPILVALVDELGKGEREGRAAGSDGERCSLESCGK